MQGCVPCQIEMIVFDEATVDATSVNAATPPIGKGQGQGGGMRSESVEGTSDVEVMKF